MKGHLRIKEDGTLEIPTETALREFFEEVYTKRITSKRKRIISMKNMLDFPALKKDQIFQCCVGSEPDSTEKPRLIGLYVVRVDETKWAFTVKDKKENQVVFHLLFSL